MKIIKKYATKSDCYKINAKIKVKGLMLHSVGCNQPKASVFANIWNKPNVGACVHAVIDAIDGTVIQCLPWEHRGWHGGGSSNDTHIGVEMGEPACIKYTSGSNFTVSDLKTAQKCVVTAYNSAVELFAYLCKKYDLNPLSDGVIVSHSEGYKRGIATTHLYYYLCILLYLCVFYENLLIVGKMLTKIKKGVAKHDTLLSFNFSCIFKCNPPCT